MPSKMPDDYHDLLFGLGDNDFDDFEGIDDIGLGSMDENVDDTIGFGGVEGGQEPQPANG